MRRPDSLRNLAARRLAPAILLTTLVGSALAGCGTDLGEPAGEAPKPGGGKCQIPSITVEPNQVAAGGQVTVKGTWFVEGCAGGTASKNLKPLTLVPIGFTDAKGAAHGLAPVDAKGAEGTFETKVTIPQEAAKGQGKISAGISAPVPVTIN